MHFSLSKYTLLKPRLPTHAGWAQQKYRSINTFKPQFVNLFGPSNKYGIHICTTKA